MPTRSPLTTRFVVGVDMQDYSSRPTRIQDDLRKDLSALLTAAAGEVGSDIAGWEIFDTGDGKLAVLPPDVDLTTIVGRFVDDLNVRLVERNGDRSPQAQLRLRVAMHSDGLVASPPGYAGPALVVLSRYLDSAPVRTALATATQAGLALILSETVHRTVVQAGMGGLRPEKYRHVVVDIPSKSFHASGFLYVPGYDMATFGEEAPPPGPPDPPSAAGPRPPSAPAHPGRAAPGARGGAFVIEGGITTGSGDVQVTYGDHHVTHGDHVEGDKYLGGRRDG